MKGYYSWLFFSMACSLVSYIQMLNDKNPILFLILSLEMFILYKLDKRYFELW